MQVCRTLFTMMFDKSIEKENYKNCDLIMNNINSKVGEMTTLGIRENLGKFPLDDNSKKLRKALNKYAHYQKDLANKNLNQLKQYEKLLIMIITCLK